MQTQTQTHTPSEIHFGIRVVYELGGRNSSSSAYLGTTKRVKADNSVEVVLDDGNLVSLPCLPNSESGTSRGLRIFNLEQCGLIHPNFQCDGCQVSPISGFRWSCTICNDFDLCSSCYQGEVHDLQHSFKRVSPAKNAAEGGCLVEQVLPARSVSRKVRLHGMFVGSRVERGPDWTWNDEDAGKGQVGTIMAFNVWGLGCDCAIVQWDKPQFLVPPVYRFGFDGKMDLKLATPTPTPTPTPNFAYLDHLPILDHHATAVLSKIISSNLPTNWPQATDSNALPALLDQLNVSDAAENGSEAHRTVAMLRRRGQFLFQRRFFAAAFNNYAQIAGLINSGAFNAASQFPYEEMTNVYWDLANCAAQDGQVRLALQNLDCISNDSGDLYQPDSALRMLNTLKKRPFDKASFCNNLFEQFFVKVVDNCAEISSLVRSMHGTVRSGQLEEKSGELFMSLDCLLVFIDRAVRWLLMAVSSKSDFKEVISREFHHGVMQQLGDLLESNNASASDRSKVLEGFATLITSVFQRVSELEAMKTITRDYPKSANRSDLVFPLNRFDWKLVREIGRGTSGAVYEDESRTKVVKLVQFRPKKADFDSDYRLLVRDLLESNVRLFNKDSICVSTSFSLVPFIRIRRDGEANYRFLLALQMEKAEGNLADWISARNERLSRQHNGRLAKSDCVTAVFIAYRVLQALQVLHNSSPAIVHGDLHGRNVLVDDTGDANAGECGVHVAVCDFHHSKMLSILGKSAELAQVDDLQAFGKILLALFSVLPEAKVEQLCKEIETAASQFDCRTLPVDQDQELVTLLGTIPELLRRKSGDSSSSSLAKTMETYLSKNNVSNYKTEADEFSESSYPGCQEMLGVIDGLLAEIKPNVKTIATYLVESTRQPRKNEATKFWISSLEAYFSSCDKLVAEFRSRTRLLQRQQQGLFIQLLMNDVATQQYYASVMQSVYDPCYKLKICLANKSISSRMASHLTSIITFGQGR